MSNLLKFEFRKVLRSKYLYILLGSAIAFILFTGLTYLAIGFIMKMADIEAGVEIIEDLYDSDSYSFTKSAVTGNFMMIIGVFIAIFACEDNSHGTSKNIIGKGYNRLQVYFSKYIVSLIITVAISLITTLVAALFGLAAWGADSFANVDDKLAVVIIGELLCVIVYHALFFMVSSSIGKMAPSIVINLIVPTGVVLVFTVIDVLINNEDFSFSMLWVEGILGNFAGSADEKYFASSFILLFVYYAAAQLVGILVNRRKQYWWVRKNNNSNLTGNH